MFLRENSTPPHCGPYLPPRIIVWTNVNLYYQTMLPHRFLSRNKKKSQYSFVKIWPLFLLTNMKTVNPPKSIDTFAEGGNNLFRRMSELHVYVFIVASIPLLNGKDKSLCSLVRINKRNIWKRIVINYLLISRWYTLILRISCK